MNETTQWTHMVTIRWRDAVTGKRRQKTCQARIDEEGFTFRHPVVVGPNGWSFQRVISPRPTFKISLPGDVDGEF